MAARPLGAAFFGHYADKTGRRFLLVLTIAGVGVLSPEMAVDYGCTGPNLRGSGVEWDLRRDGEPICRRMYEGYEFEVVLRQKSV